MFFMYYSSNTPCVYQAFHTRLSVLYNSYTKTSIFFRKLIPIKKAEAIGTLLQH